MLTCWRTHTLECRQTIHRKRVTDSMWTVRFDTDGNSLHRTHVDDANDTPDAKRMKLTHKQTLEKKNKCHDDTIDRDAGKKDSERTQKQRPDSPSAIPDQVEQPVSSILKH